MSDTDITIEVRTDLARRRKVDHWRRCADQFLAWMLPITLSVVGGMILMILPFPWFLAVWGVISAVIALLAWIKTK